MDAILKSLPIEPTANRWSDEVYFTVNVGFKTEEISKEVVELGDVAYWILGDAICLFFGKTPISDDEIRPAGAVNVIGRVVQGLKELKKVRDEDRVFIEL